MMAKLNCDYYRLTLVTLSCFVVLFSVIGLCHGEAQWSRFYVETPIESAPLEIHQNSRVKRGAAYPGGHGDFSGVAKMSTFAALGSYGGFLGHGKGSTAGGYEAGSGRNGYGGITIAGALGSYGGYLGHKGPTVISSGGYGHGGLLFNKH